MTVQPDSQPSAGSQLGDLYQVLYHLRGSAGMSGGRAQNTQYHQGKKKKKKKERTVSI
jgi:hypothetical protein